MAISILLDLIGGVSLLLWGLHMVQSGILRAFGPRLKAWLGRLLKTRLHALAAGVGVTALLQSSTATGLMLSSFAAAGMIDLVPAMAVMLGANIGTTLIVQLLSFDTSAVAPALLFTGLVAFKRGGRTVTRDLGRVAIGLGLMLLSLHLLLTDLAPAEHAPLVGQMLQALTDQPLLTLLLGAVLTWAAHSSVATVLLTMSLAYSGFVTPTAALALVLGANLGSALNPLLEVGDGGNLAKRRVPVANLVNRVVGCVLVLPFVHLIGKTLLALEPNPVRMVADFHTGFNVALALLFILPLPWMARLLERLLPESKPQDDVGTPLYLDDSLVEMPSVALANAARETLHMGDIVETMLRQGTQALLAGDRKLADAVAQLDDAVDKLHEAIKLHLVRITQESLDDVESRRAMEIMTLSVNLEHIGDIIDKNLMELAQKKIRRQLQFSAMGQEEIAAFVRLIQESLQLAFSVFLSGDVKVARQLVAQKTRVRELEAAASENHLERLRDGVRETLETSSLHLDVLRDLKRIHSHIAATAYPALEAAGQLRNTRLKSRDD
ncbi:Na/Pi cotransporter family protein [Thiomonas intermedia]|uniref:Na/Pi cotransporter family protein n=1 Tax=Thiomonas intermedia TaxID=926 RepID=UPI0009A52493|nr:Na/Pi cotransporter family protein [Thiomonas intermedia]